MTWIDWTACSIVSLWGIAVVIFASPPVADRHLVHPITGGRFTAQDDRQAARLKAKGWQAITDDLAAAMDALAAGPDAWSLGRQARADGRSIVDVPYPDDSTAGSAWLRGYAGFPKDPDPPKARRGTENGGPR